MNDKLADEIVKMVKEKFEKDPNIKALITVSGGNVQGVETKDKIDYLLLDWDNLEDCETLEEAKKELGL